MQRFIGLDAHGQSCTLCVMGPSGRRLGHHVVETNGKALVQQLRSIAGERHVCMEEGTLIDVNYFYRSTTTRITGRRQVVRASSRASSLLS